jgi:hypothetical protein
MPRKYKGSADELSQLAEKVLKSLVCHFQVSALLSLVVVGAPSQPVVRTRLLNLYIF